VFFSFSKKSFLQKYSERSLFQAFLERFSAIEDTLRIGSHVEWEAVDCWALKVSIIVALKVSIIVALKVSIIVGP